MDWLNIKKSIFCALDFKKISEAKKLLNIISSEIGGIKIGLELFIANGPKVIKEFKKFNLPIFLDLKLHDIPNTVFEAIKSSIDMEPDYLSIHISGGSGMLKKISSIKKRPKLIGITLLTSLDGKNLKEQGINISTHKYVQKLVEIAMDSDLDGVVASPSEINLINEMTPKKFILITPGIRLKEDTNDDQKRFATPGSALKNGASILIIGRTITGSKDPLKTINDIKENIKNEEYS